LSSHDDPGHRFNIDSAGVPLAPAASGVTPETLEQTNFLYLCISLSTVLSLLPQRDEPCRRHSAHHNTHFHEEYLSILCCSMHVLEMLKSADLLRLFLMRSSVLLESQLNCDFISLYSSILICQATVFQSVFSRGKGWMAAV
jgi:hypothetical protein